MFLTVLEMERRAADTLPLTHSPPLTSQYHSLLRGLALAVLLSGAGPFLAQQRGHLLSISVLHSLQKTVIILVPLVCLWGETKREVEG